MIPLELAEKFWLVSADMGYGHQRAIYPLKELSKGGEIINANNSPKSNAKEKRLWKEMLNGYEFMSRAGKIPLIGNLIRKLLGSITQLGVTTVVAQHPDTIKSIGQFIFQHIFHNKKTES